MSRTGKIARLPRFLQDELNERLDRNTPGPQILDWLNSHPDTRSVLHDYFDGSPVSAQNLSDWRSGGFAEWQYRQGHLNELRAFSADVAQMESALSPMAGHATRLLSLHYALTMARGETDAGLDMRRVEALKPLFAMTRAVTALRTIEQRDTLIQLKQQQLARTRACTCGCASSRTPAVAEPAPVPAEPLPASRSKPAAARKPQRPPPAASSPAPAPAPVSASPPAPVTPPETLSIPAAPAPPPPARLVPSTPPSSLPAPASAVSVLPALYDLPAAPAAPPLPLAASPRHPASSSLIKVIQGSSLKLIFDDPDPAPPPRAVTGFAGSRGY